MPRLDHKKRTAFERRLGALEGERSSWIGHWRDIADFILPRRGRFLDDRPTTSGRKLNSKIIDSTGTIAHRTGVAGLMAGMTSPARPWFRLTVPDFGLMNARPVRAWLDDVTDRMNHVFHRSNLYTQLPALYEELLAFGTGAMCAVEDREDVIRFYTYTAGEYMIANGARLAVDTIYRKFPMTVAQLVEQFGEENCSRRTLDLWKGGADAQSGGQPDAWIDVVNVIEPNDDRILDMRDARGKRWRSVYYEVGVTDEGDKDLYLRVGGFDEFPVMAPRWHVTGVEVYGRSPAMDALGDVKQLQLMEKKAALAVDKMVDPPMVAPTSLRTSPVSIMPGDVTFVDVTAAGQQSGFRPAYELNPRLNEFEGKTQQVRDRIRSAFYADLFMMIANSDRRQITAEEIRARQEEKMLMLGPVLERLQDELLDPLIDRTFSIGLRAGIFPPAPPELQGQALQVEYTSILAQAQRALGIGGIERVVGFIGSMARTNPEVLDKLDTDEAIDQYAQMVGTPARIIRSDEDVAQIRGTRQQQQAAQQAAAAAAGMAQQAKVLSETDTEGKNALTDVAGALAGATGR